MQDYFSNLVSRSLPVSVPQVMPAPLLRDRAAADDSFGDMQVLMPRQDVTARTETDRRHAKNEHTSTSASDVVMRPVTSVMSQPESPTRIQPNIPEQNYSPTGTKSINEKPEIFNTLIYRTQINVPVSDKIIHGMKENQDRTSQVAGFESKGKGLKPAVNDDAGKKRRPRTAKSQKDSRDLEEGTQMIKPENEKRSGLQIIQQMIPDKMEPPRFPIRLMPDAPMAKQLGNAPKREAPRLTIGKIVVEISTPHNPPRPRIVNRIVQTPVSSHPARTPRLSFGLSQL